MVTLNLEGTMRKIRVTLASRSATPFEVTSYDKQDRQLEGGAVEDLEDARKLAIKRLGKPSVKLVVIDEQGRGPIEGYSAHVGVIWKMLPYK